MLTFEMTHTHETLGRLKIGFSVNERGEFALDFIDIRWRPSPDMVFNFWTIHLYRDNSCWAMGWWQRRWANGKVADNTHQVDTSRMTFLPALLDFANSEEFALLVGRKLKHNMGLMSAAMLDAAAKAQREVVLPSGS